MNAVEFFLYLTYDSKKDNGIRMDIQQIVESFKQINYTTQQLCNELPNQQSEMWLLLTPEQDALGVKPLQLAQNSYSEYWYQNGQDGRETTTTIGLIGVDETLLNIANQLNQQKNLFKQQVQTFQKLNKRNMSELKKHLNNTSAPLRESLHFSGLSRLHLKQCWRQIPILERTPSRVGFNWYQSGRSIQKITVAQAQQALLKLDIGSKHIQTQLSKLSRLNQNTPLAKVQNLAPSMRANIFYDDNQLPMRHAMNIAMPILYKSKKTGELPIHNTPECTAPSARKRAVRSDKRIESEAFLPSLRIHQYLQN